MIWHASNTYIIGFTMNSVVFTMKNTLFCLGGEGAPAGGGNRRKVVFSICIGKINWFYFFFFCCWRIECLVYAKRMRCSKNIHSNEEHCLLFGGRPPAGRGNRRKLYIFWFPWVKSSDFAFFPLLLENRVSRLRETCDLLKKASTPMKNTYFLLLFYKYHFSAGGAK